MKAITKNASPQSAAGPLGLRYGYLQAALYGELVEDLAAFATLVLFDSVLFLVFLCSGKRRG